MKGIKISFSYDDTHTLIQVLDHIINNKADKYDIGVIEILKDELLYRLQKSNK